MSLLIFALSIIIFCIAVSLIWKIIKTVVLLPFRVEAFGAPPKVKPLRHYFSQDETGFWYEKNGRYFRYDLTKDSSEEDARYNKFMEQVNV